MILNLCSSFGEMTLGRLTVPSCGIYSLFRENRVRRFLGTRYDSRENAVDWDYHMKLREAVYSG
jgi:Domain of unknown function (DUF4471)